MRLFAGKGTKQRSDSDSHRGWMKSSLSMHDGNCVEVTGLGDEVILVRDSKHPRGTVLRFTTAEWDAFIGGVHLGEFDRKRHE